MAVFTKFSGYIEVDSVTKNRIDSNTVAQNTWPRIQLTIPDTVSNKIVFNPKLIQISPLVYEARTGGRYTFYGKDLYDASKTFSTSTQIFDYRTDPATYNYLTKYDVTLKANSSGVIYATEYLRAKTTFVSTIPTADYVLNINSTTPDITYTFDNTTKLLSITDVADNSPGGNIIFNVVQPADPNTYEIRVQHLSLIYSTTRFTFAQFNFPAIYCADSNVYKSYAGPGQPSKNNYNAETYGGLEYTPRADGSTATTAVLNPNCTLRLSTWNNNTILQNDCIYTVEDDLGDGTFKMLYTTNDYAKINLRATGVIPEIDANAAYKFSLPEFNIYVSPPRRRPFPEQGYFYAKKHGLLNNTPVKISYISPFYHKSFTDNSADTKVMYIVQATENTFKLSFLVNGDPLPLSEGTGGATYTYSGPYATDLRLTNFDNGERDVWGEPAGTNKGWEAGGIFVTSLTEEDYALFEIPALKGGLSTSNNDFSKVPVKFGLRIRSYRNRQDANIAAYPLAEKYIPVLHTNKAVFNNIPIKGIRTLCNNVIFGQTLSGTPSEGNNTTATYLAIIYSDTTKDDFVLFDNSTTSTLPINNRWKLGKLNKNTSGVPVSVKAGQGTAGKNRYLNYNVGTSTLTQKATIAGTPNRATNTVGSFAADLGPANIQDSVSNASYTFFIVACINNVYYELTITQNFSVSDLSKILVTTATTEFNVKTSKERSVTINPIERVKIDENGIVLKDNTGKITFNTDNKYLSAGSVSNTKNFNVANSLPIKYPKFGNPNTFDKLTFNTAGNIYTTTFTPAIYKSLVLQDVPRFSYTLAEVKDTGYTGLPNNAKLSWFVYVYARDVFYTSYIIILAININGVPSTATYSGYYNVNYYTFNYVDTNSVLKLPLNQDSGTINRYWQEDLVSYSSLNSTTIKIGDII